jgi:hypothetical protein
VAKTLTADLQGVISDFKEGTGFAKEKPSVIRIRDAGFSWPKKIPNVARKYREERKKFGIIPILKTL